VKKQAQRKRDGRLAAGTRNTPQKLGLHIMRIGHYRLAPDWGQIAFTTAVAGWIVWYYFDARAASSNLQNMLLIRPATIVALILYCVVIFQALNVAPDEPRTGRSPEGAKSPASLRAPGIAASLIAYVVLLPYLGFDIATFLFVAATMVVAGERRWWVALLFAAAFSAFLALAFKFALSTPVPTTLF
jgi:putative tricarboxylic transport membrane protein